ncbi:MAG: hypothetical protein LC101_08780, partial [Flavobacteriales bacterium]|nr:hypothetical protein [Flavobacteriales bacterium]
MSNAIFSLSATKMAELIRRGELSSYELVSKHIERAKKVNPIINAIVVERYKQALKDAKKADESIVKGLKTAPLHGVPCT